MIIFKNNKIEVENPKEIELNGIYYGIIIRSDIISDTMTRCYIYIPEIYGAFDHVYNRVVDYPRVEIPIKQDNDDEGHIPQTGEVVKISFDDGSVNDCRFCFLVPIGEEQRIRNANYITKGILSADIEDIEDPDILNKILEFINYAYYITINSKTSINTSQPIEDDFKLQVLLSNPGFLNYFIEPLIMPLAAQATIIDNSTNNDVTASGSIGMSPFFTSVIYLMYDVIQETPNTDYNTLLEIFNNPPSRQASDATHLSSYNPENAFNNTDNPDDNKVLSAACLISGIPLFAIKIIFPEVDNTVVDFGSDSNGVKYPWTLYKAYELDKQNGWGNATNYYSKFIYSHKTDYEKEWATTMSSWLSGINAIIPSGSSLNIIIAFCLNLCPWMATTLIGYDISNYQIQQSAYDQLKNQYDRLHAIFRINERTYDALFTDDNLFIKTTELLNDAIKQGDAINFITVFEEQAKECFKYSLRTIIYDNSELNGVNTWEACGMPTKFNKLRECANDITNKWLDNSNTTTNGGNILKQQAKRYFNIPLDSDLQDYIYTLCTENNVPYELMIGLIETESNFNPNAISAGGDYGLCQINKVNHDWLSKTYGVTNFLNPYQNVLCGVKMLSSNLKNYNNDIHKSLMAYNMGATGASNLWKKGQFTSEYSNKVFSNYEKYLNM